MKCYDVPASDELVGKARLKGFTMTKTKFLAIAASAALVAMLGLAACGGGSSSASSAASSASASSAASSAASASAAAESSAASESAAAESEAAESEAAESAEATSAAAASTEKVDVSSWTSAWMGASDKGETFYYAESPDASQGAMLVYDPSTNKYVSYVGAISQPEEGYVRITDIQSGNALQFEVTAGDDEGVVIDLGDLGNAVLAKCEISEVMKCIQNIDTYGEAVA